ncbi:RNase A-like domain-containing protein [Clostridium felsineum]|uniref:RNase A-like domain-containing protein n=1 Tax=Clostridium felsineum TaxID=36839 RepID=UPI0020332449|nr:RNase A-like domain-containing protein [Clostridium felsineum]URZ03974.1 hypothetical protein CLAUR_040400 [Clostridium felsineum]
MSDKIKMEVLIMDSMIAKFRQMGDKFGTIISKLRQAQGGVQNAYIGDSSIKIQRNINDTLKSGKEVTETLYKLSIQLNSAKDDIIRADKDSYNNIKLNTIIRGEEDFSKVTASKETISNMEKIIGNAKRIQTGIGYFELGASISVANNLILGLPGLLGVYNDKRLIYKLENEKRYGVLAAYQYGRVAGDLEGEIQGTIELFSGMSIMGFGGLGAGALTVATDGAAAPAVPAVESVGIAVAAHGIGMTTSSLSHMGSDFAKGNFYFSEMKSRRSKISNVGNDILDIMESNGGHTLDRHVGKSKEYLEKRVGNMRQGSDGATSFSDKNTAIKATKDVLKQNLDKIDDWLVNRTSNRLTLKTEHNFSVGYGVSKNSGKYIDNISKTVTVIQKTSDNELGFKIITCYPKLN